MIKAKLDPNFLPMAKVLADFKTAVAKENSQKVIIAVERNDKFTATFDLDIFADNTGHDEENYEIA